MDNFMYIKTKNGSGIRPHDPVGPQEQVEGGPEHRKRRKRCQHMLDEDGIEIILYLNLV
jgi:hypothetical protein